MTPLEMHIGIDLQVEKLKSEAYADIKSEHKDWALNEAQEIFINERINPEIDANRKGFQVGQKRLDDLEELMGSAILPLYKQDSERMFAILPYNYRHLVIDMPSVAKICSSADIYTETIVSKYIAVIPFKDSKVNLYKDFKISYKTNNAITTLFDIKDYPSISDGLNENEEKFVLINLVIEEINSKFNNLEIRWETYDEKYFANSFVIISSDIDAVSVSVTTDTVDQVNFVAKDYIGVQFSMSTKKAVNRLTSGEIAQNMANARIGGTKAESPISTIKQGKLIVYRNEGFIFNTIYIDYIRKPRLISLSLNRSCEINKNFHNEVVNIASSIIAGRINSPTFPALMEERNRQE